MTEPSTLQEGLVTEDWPLGLYIKNLMTALRTLKDLATEAWTLEDLVTEVWPLGKGLATEV